MYKNLIQPLLFNLEAEKAHEFTFNNLKRAFKIPFVKNIFESLYNYEDLVLEKNLFGLKFKNPLGLAAGFDKNAILVDELAALGFGFIEIGTLTPKPQPGNEKPRMFRLKEDEALINRMGFNNEGVAAAKKRLEKRKSTIIIGGNIGKNKDTPNENATSDYIFCFKELFEAVDYFVVNVSSPNTPNLRELQDKVPLKNILHSLQEINQGKKNPKPLLLKIAPDLNNAQLDDIIEIAIETNLNGLVATNTTISRENLKTNKEIIAKIGSGGLSGQPLKNKSTEIIRYIKSISQNKFSMIGAGGISGVNDAIDKINAGADLLQVYTGFIYDGPGICKKINSGLLGSGIL